MVDDSSLDRLTTWRERYLRLAVTGVRSPAVTAKITLHLQRFIDFFTTVFDYGKGGQKIGCWEPLYS